MKTSITKKHHQALTLVEVIIVTILIGLATILVLPAFAHHGGCKSTRINCLPAPSIYEATPREGL
jgi:competence protein ComGC